MITPKAKLPELSLTAAQQATVVNMDLAILDQLVDRTVKSRGVNTPPGSPADGDAYIVGTSPTGLWVGKSNQIAYWRTSAGAWQFIAPLEGWTVRVQDDDDTNGIPKEYGYTGSAWAAPAGSGGSFTGGTLTSALNEAPIVTVASASTTAIGAAAANTVNISGTTTINAFDSIASGAKRRVVFQGELTLTYNDTSMILPTGASITTAAGDAAEFVSLGSGNWKCFNYQRADGTPLAGGGGGGGLTNFTDTKNTAGPNGSGWPAAVLAVNVTQAQADFVLNPKGYGAITRDTPDNSTTGGNKRGQRAVDLQGNRNTADKVASGTYSVVGGGSSNSATGQASCVPGGTTNLASGTSSFAAGSSCTASGGSAIAMGSSATSGGTSSIALTTSSSVPGDYSAALGGTTNTVTGNLVVMLGSTWASTRGINGIMVHNSARFGGTGGAQGATLKMTNETTTATPADLTSDQAANAATNILTMPNNSAYTFEARVIARNPNTGDAAGWKITGVIKRGANAAATAFVGTPTVTALGADSAASAWTVVAKADTSIGGLTFTVTGAASTTVRWLADAWTAELVAN